MQWSMRVLVVDRLSTAAAGSSLRALRVPSTGHRTCTPEEIALLIAEAATAGLEPQEPVRLHRALAWPPQRATADGAPWTPRRDCRVASVREVLRRVTSSPYSQLPVYRGSIDNIIASSTKDVVQCEGAAACRSRRCCADREGSRNDGGDRLLAFLRERRSIRR
jgi:CBS domain containing-hemolysin-like protein